MKAVFMESLRFLLCGLLFGTMLGAQHPAGVDLLREARQRQEAGDLQAARRLYESAVAALRREEPAGQQLTETLIQLSAITAALGDYESSAGFADEATTIAMNRNDDAGAAGALNRVGSARLFQGRYPEAMAAFRAALERDQRLGDTEGQVLRWNNIGTVHFYQAAYDAALQAYGEAERLLENTGGVDWVTHWLYVTTVNRVTVYQRLGQYERALELYLRLADAERVLSPRERALLFGNLGALYRNLGDPVKALDYYRKARLLFDEEKDLDGTLGVLKNSGIARALDLEDSRGALAVFDEVVALAEQSGNRREGMQARLYRARTLFQLGRLKQAGSDLELALASARELDAPEEEWKALYWLGRISVEQGARDEAAARFEDSWRIIESIRSSLSESQLTARFLADKRDVADARISLLLEDQADPGTLLNWTERVRARSFQDQLARGAQFLGNETVPMESAGLQKDPLADAQAQLGDDAALIAYWVSAQRAAAVWITRRAAGVHAIPWSPDRDDEVRRLARNLSNGSGTDWRGMSDRLGRLLLDGIEPLAGKRFTTVGILPDGVLHLLPFEALSVQTGTSAERNLLLEQAIVSYLPSLVPVLGSRRAGRLPAMPWQPSLVALAAPGTAAATGSTSPIPALPFADEEVRRTASLLPGGELLLTGAGTDHERVRGALATAPPVVHLATHALLDDSQPERSCIVVGRNQGEGGSTCLYLAEVPRLDLKTVDLVTVSACQTELGRLVRGEGLQSFGRAFLLAGARSTVTTLWAVPDESTSIFMEQFYYRIARGVPRGAALRESKLEFLGHGPPLNLPRYWAPFVLTGEAASAVDLPLRWRTVVWPALALSAVLATVFRKRIIGSRWS